MTSHAVYAAIVKAVKTGKMKEPFGVNEFRSACPGFGEGTYNAFLYKHRKGNPGEASELFDMVDKGCFRLIKPFKYGL